MADAPASLVVFGAAGQIGRSLCALTPPPGWRVVPYDRAGVDITRPDQVKATLAGIERGMVVNLAAYTQVDKAEAEPDAAFAVNRDAAGTLAQACDAAGLALVHLSTDYVFPGTNPEPVVEDEPTGPLNVYGASKLAGERAVLDSASRALVLRTSWVFGPHGHNFAKTILRRCAMQSEIGVVDDQVGCPTPAPAIAAALWALAPRLVDAPAGDAFGIFHYCGDEAVSWCGFARAIVAEATRLGRPEARIRAITSADYPLPARRPARSVLNCAKLAA
ncbi:MAG TPA: dTDP-4-dehydrorhamnose reductase, partial [Magnetospirillum sp.]|nr:dTDP-4-dehydrorhamnose reductase [Magnetospirillum sp.]